MNKISAWIQAFRLRTLPLALSCGIVGSALAYVEGSFSWKVFILTLLTITLLQILSNLANDYGDSVNGVDNKKRLGPERTVQSGKISKREMKKLIRVFIFLSLISGISLIYFGLKNSGFGFIALFLLLGIASIAAAVKYTVGKKPYGYSGWGDLFVFLFFGIVGVCGTYFLHVNQLDVMVLLPASAIGLFSTGVLNLNNMRDIQNDSANGKKTMVVRLGTKKAKIYHLVLIIIPLVLTLVYMAYNWNSLIQLIFLITTIPLSFHLYLVFYKHIPQKLNIQLKMLALNTLFYAITFSAGIILASW